MYLNDSKARVENIDAGLVERRSAREERSKRTLGARQIEYQLIDRFHLSKYEYKRIMHTTYPFERKTIFEYDLYLQVLYLYTYYGFVSNGQLFQ